MIDPTYDGLSVTRQCELLKVPRSTHYYRPQETESDELREGLRTYFEFYNAERPHNGLGGKTPNEAYFDALSDQAQVA